MKRIAGALGAITLLTTTLGLTTLATAQVAITGSSAPAEEETEKADWNVIGGSPNAIVGSTNSSANTDGGDSDVRLASVADDYQHAVGLVVGIVPNEGPDPIGTAWAFEPTMFATNGHVLAAMQRLREKNPGTQFVISMNRQQDVRLRVIDASVHPQYGKADVRFDGKVARSGYDIAILETQTAAKTHFRLATETQLKSLKSGSRVAYLGFPMEALDQNNVDPASPVATMQSGIVTSLSDYFMVDSGFTENRLVRHNLAAAGGASGSPIFTPEGVVVAILWGGNVTPALMVGDDGSVGYQRRANAALVNFAERIDSLKGVPRP